MSNKTTQIIMKATLGVAIITIVSKVFGFVRDALFAAYYGSNNATDAYFFAQNMPKMLFPAVCNSIATAFLSIYVSKSVQFDHYEGDKYASKALSVAGLIAVSLSILGIIGANWIVPLLAPGFDAETMSLSVKLTQIVMVSFVMLMGQCMFAAILNARKSFIRVQIGAIFFNVVAIGGIILFGHSKDVVTLTWVIVIGHTLQNMLLFIFAKKNFTLSMPDKLFDEDIARMLRLALPILLGNSVYQINNIVDKNLGSNLGEGAVSALSYSGTLNLLVTAVFITSLATVLYPTLAQIAAEGKDKEYGENLLNSISMITIVMMPIAIITFLFSDDIVRIVYERGHFNPEATAATSAALRFYSIGYVFNAVRDMVVRGFYAREDSKTPMINGAVGVGVNIVASIALYRTMGLAGIALGTSISGIISAVLLMMNMRKKLSGVRLRTKLGSAVKIVAAGAITVPILYLLNMWLLGVTGTSTLHSLIRFVTFVIVGFGAYYLLLLAMKCQELKMIVSFIKKALAGFKKKRAG